MRTLKLRQILLPLLALTSAQIWAQSAKEVIEKTEANRRRTSGIKEAQEAGLDRVKKMSGKDSEQSSHQSAGQTEELASPGNDSSCGHALSVGEINHLRQVRGWVDQMLANPTGDNINSVTETMTKSAARLANGDLKAQSYLMMLTTEKLEMEKNNMLNSITKRIVDNPELFNETSHESTKLLTKEEKALLKSLSKNDGIENPLGILQKMARERHDSYKLLEQRGAKVNKDGSWDFSKIDTKVIAKGGPDKDALINAWAQFVPAIAGNHATFVAGQDPKTNETKKVADVIADPNRKGPLFLESSVIMPHNGQSKAEFVPEVLTLDEYGKQMSSQLEVFEKGFAEAQLALKDVNWKDFSTGKFGYWKEYYLGIKRDLSDNPYGETGSPATDRFAAAMKNMKAARTALIQRFGLTRSAADEIELKNSQTNYRKETEEYYKGIYDSLKSKQRTLKPFHTWYQDNFNDYKANAPSYKPPVPQSKLAALDVHIAALESNLAAGLDRAHSELLWKSVTVATAPVLAIGGAAFASRRAVGAGENLFTTSNSVIPYLTKGAWKSWSISGSTSSVPGLLGVWGSYGNVFAAGLGVEAATWLGSSAVESLTTDESFKCAAWSRFEKNAGAALALNSVFATLGPIGDGLGAAAAKGSGVLARTAQGARLGFLGVGGVAMGAGAYGAYNSGVQAWGNRQTAQKYGADGDSERAAAYHRAAGQNWADLTTFAGAMGLSFVGMKAFAKKIVPDKVAESHIKNGLGAKLGSDLFENVVKNGYKTSSDPTVLSFKGREGWLADALVRFGSHPDGRKALENAQTRKTIIEALHSMDDDAFEFVMALKGPQFLKAFKNRDAQMAFNEINALKHKRAITPEESELLKNLQAIETDRSSVSADTIANLKKSGLIDGNGAMTKLGKTRHESLKTDFVNPKVSPELAADFLSAFDDDGLKGLNEVLAEAKKLRIANPSMNADERIKKAIVDLIKSRGQEVDPKRVFSDAELEKMYNCLRL